MSKNLSKQNKAQLLDSLALIKAHLKAEAKSEEREKLIACVEDLEAELRVRRYGLVYEEHREEIEELLATKAPILNKEDELSVYGGGVTHALIEGDNLASLTALKTDYEGKIDFIYIDPPYNKGKDGSPYKDKYVEGEDDYRHSYWSSFMAKRLSLAKELMAEDGLICISIDDNEFAALKLLCDKIFGEKNKLSIHHIQVRYGNKSLNEKKDFQEVCEYVLFYAKNARKFKANKPAEEYSLDKFCYEIRETGEYTEEVIGGRKVKIFKKGAYEIEKKNIGCLGFLKATWASGSVVKGNASGKYFETHLKPRKEIDGLGTLYKVEGIGEDGLGYRYFTGPQKPDATQGQFYSGVPLERVKEMAAGTSKKYRPIGNFYDFAADFGNIRHEGGVAFNGGKKPTKMLRQFICYHQRKDITVLDFFAGSASTGHAVLDQNAADGGQRKFIMCTSNEENICRDIAYKRLCNAMQGKEASLDFYTVAWEDKE